MTDPVIRPLGPQRHARLVGLVAFAIWASVAALVGWWLWRAHTSLGDGAPMVTAYATFGLCGLAVLCITTAQGIADAQLQYGDEALTVFSGKDRVIRWGRIVEVHPARFGQEVAVSLHGKSRWMPIPGTRWTTAAERAELVEEFESRRDAALKRQRRRERAEQRRLAAERAEAARAAREPVEVVEETGAEPEFVHGEPTSPEAWPGYRVRPRPE